MSWICEWLWGWGLMSASWWHELSLFSFPFYLQQISYSQPNKRASSHYSRTQRVGGGGEGRLVNAKQGRHARETENLWKSRQASRRIRHAVGPGERPVWRQRRRRISRSQPSFPRVTRHALGFPSSSNSDFPHRGGGEQKGVRDWPLGCTGHRRMDLFLSSSMDFWGKTSVTEGGGGEERKRGRQVYQRPLKEQVPCCRLQDFSRRFNPNLRNFLLGNGHPESPRG